MFAKTFCKPGSYLAIVPVGLRATLQYNANGVLEKIFRGYSDDKLNITKEVFDSVKKSKLVPLSISIKGGTTWVEGVFYTSKPFNAPGILPMCIEPDMIADLKSNPSDYKFYAGRVESLAASFQAVLTFRNWLKMSNFETLPMFMIPDKLTNEAFIKLVNTDRYPFKFPLISGYMIFERTGHKYQPLDLIQKAVKSVDIFTDDQGYIKASVADDTKAVTTYHYSDILNYDISSSSVIVCESDGKVIYSNTKSILPKTNKLTCSCCGNQFISPVSGPVWCTDNHCLSKLYPSAARMLDTFGLPVLPYDKFKKYVDKKKILCLTDVLLLPEYKNASISVTLLDLLRALVPIDVCADSSELFKISYLCSNSTKTFRYYIENPDRLKMELSSNVSLMLNRLITWLADPYNATTLLTLIDSNQVTILETDKKFDGAPIFRGKKIAITGRFRHGDAAEVVSILKSYGGEVTIGIDVTADCLVIGDLRENIDGRSVQLAKEHNIATFYESDFFAQYQIDEDISANLL